MNQSPPGDLITHMPFAYFKYGAKTEIFIMSLQNPPFSYSFEVYFKNHYKRRLEASL